MSLLLWQSKAIAQNKPLKAIAQSSPLKEISTPLKSLDSSNKFRTFAQNKPLKAIDIFKPNQTIANGEQLKVIAKPLPCLNSSNECLKVLTLAAVANSYRIDAVQTQINIIDTKDLVISDRIEYVDRKRWVNFFSNNPVEMPFKLVANIFGGGDLQRDRIAIADLEVKRATLLAGRARLLANIKEYEYQLREDILELLIEYESNIKARFLIEDRLDSLEFKYQVFLIDYTGGQSNTDKFMSFSSKKADLEFKRYSVDNKIRSSIRKLKYLTGYE